MSPCLQSQVWVNRIPVPPALCHLACFTGGQPLVPSCAVPFTPDLSVSSTTILSSDPYHLQPVRSHGFLSTLPGACSPYSISLCQFFLLSIGSYLPKQNLASVIHIPHLEAFSGFPVPVIWSLTFTFRKPHVAWEWAWVLVSPVPFSSWELRLSSLASLSHNCIMNEMGMIKIRSLLDYCYT